MYYSVLQLRVILVILLIMIPVGGETTRSEIASWTWSKDIDRGIYRWNVTSFSISGESIQRKEHPLQVIEGSIIEIKDNHFNSIYRICSIRYNSLIFYFVYLALVSMALNFGQFKFLTDL